MGGKNKGLEKHEETRVLSSKKMPKEMVDRRKKRFREKHLSPSGNSGCLVVLLIGFILAISLVSI